MQPELTRTRMNFRTWFRSSTRPSRNTTTKSESCRWFRNTRFVLLLNNYLACLYNSATFFPPRWRSWWTDCCAVSTSWRRRASCRTPPAQKLNGRSTMARVKRAWRRSASTDSTGASVGRTVRVCSHRSHVWPWWSCLTFWFLPAATVYGQGVYFAVNSALSVQNQYSPPNADGYKFIFVSKVLTGDYTKGCHSMKTAPLKESGDIPLRYDSVTDNISKPTMFVIFNDTQAFPEYLITCQRIHCWVRQTDKTQILREGLFVFPSGYENNIWLIMLTLVLFGD